MRIALDLLPPEMQAQALRQIAPDRAARLAGGGLDDVVCGPESKLQAAVELELKRRGWHYWHSNGKTAKGNQAGWPDLLCFGPRGRVLLIELKTASGKLSREQSWRHEALAMLGHRVHVCRSLAAVVRLLDEEYEENA